MAVTYVAAVTSGVGLALFVIPPFGQMPLVYQVAPGVSRLPSGVSPMAFWDDSVSPCVDRSRALAPPGGRLDPTPR
jgi:hypothetical protein